MSLVKKTVHNVAYIVYDDPVYWIKLLILTPMRPVRQPSFLVSFSLVDIGGYKESFNEPLVVLDGAISDVMIFTHKCTMMRNGMARQPPW
jgi:hypothetical protein